ncbi:MAG: sulfite exporter TauE/SafE family protein [Phycisphaeraceae bacterium]|nr:sulfite exporter TauE/SafE family protein [Phycisphaeraceae bacterium]
MLALLGSVLTASLLGSLHCAGMCGPIAAAATAPVSLTINRRPTDNRANAAVCSSVDRPTTRPLTIAYHAFRCTTYVVLGAAAGLLGQTFDLAGTLVGISRPAAMLAGVLLIIGALLAIGALLGLQTTGHRFGRSLGQVLAAVHQRLAPLSPTVRAAAIGALSGLLPCGWLWAFVLVAAATANPAAGAAVMAAFWLGTVPAVAGAAMGLRLLAWPVRRHAPLLSAVVMLVIGLLAVSGRVVLPAMNSNDRPAGPADCPLCHDSPPSAVVLPVKLPPGTP